jgi:NADPH:quinone reductase-like Zn-dependent oxidoreductase
MIKVEAWAMNPCDAMLQDHALPFISYPVILGEDIAGIVEAVGFGAASKFTVGDRVIGLALGAMKRKTKWGGFQDYVVVDDSLACKIPDSLSFSDASVFPLCISSSSFALFSKEFLGLPFPTTKPIETGKSILIWGGSSAVGSNAIQLSRAAGLTVITTCSPRNFDYVKSLGAEVTFDYSSPSVIDDVAAELDKGICMGIYHATGQVAASCQVSYKSKQKLLVASSNPVREEDVPAGVEAKMTFGSGGAAMFQELLPTTFGGFLPEALAKGVYKVAPRPEVVPTRGLEGIQDALDILKKGVSAKKVVVRAK